MEKLVSDPDSLSMETKDLVKDACYVLEELSGISGRIKALGILESNKDNEALRFLLETALHPFLHYGVRDINPEITTGSIQLDNLKKLRSSLVTREVTGNAAKSLLNITLSCDDPIVIKWLKRSFEKNLRANVAIGSVNTVFSNFIPTFEVGACEMVDIDVNTNLPILSGEWVIEPKYDGIRCLCFVDEVGNSVFYSRRGKPLYNLQHIEKEINKLNLRNVVLDGEAIADDWNGSISVLRSQGKHEDSKSLKYYIFDIVRFDQWVNKNTDPLYTRKSDLTNNILSMIVSEGLTYVQVVGTRKVTFPQDGNFALEIYSALRSVCEGAVLKKTDSKYPFGRSSDWLKWKDFETFDLKITSISSGTGRNKDRLGAIICDHEGVSVRVGSGFDDAQRDEFWINRETLIGKTIEVKAQEVTKDGSLRFPVFVRLRPDKD